MGGGGGEVELSAWGLSGAGRWRRWRRSRSPMKARFRWAFASRISASNWTQHRSRSNAASRSHFFDFREGKFSRWQIRTTKKKIKETKEKIESYEHEAIKSLQKVALPS